jgi:hypothetical protein
MATEIGQTSQAHPAAVFDGKVWHMLFMSHDSSNRLLYVTSDDGGVAWAMGPGTGQTTSTAPGIALVQPPPPVPGVTAPTLLVAVFVANDSSARILYSVLDLNESPGLRAWRFGGQVAGESAISLYAVGGRVATVFFTASDLSGRLLQAEFLP